MAAYEIIWKDELQNIQKKLDDKVTILDIAKDYGVSRQRLYQVMEKFGLECLDKRKKNFLKDKPPKVYWLNKMLSRKGFNKRDRLNILNNELIDLPAVCPALGIEINYDGGNANCTGGGFSGRQDNSPSLDKIDPSKGYVLDNVQVISWRANRIKNDSTPEELIKIAEYMKKYIN